MDVVAETPRAIVAFPYYLLCKKKFNRIINGIEDKN